MEAADQSQFGIPPFPGSTTAMFELCIVIGFLFLPQETG